MDGSDAVDRRVLDAGLGSDGTGVRPVIGEAHGKGAHGLPRRERALAGGMDRPVQAADDSTDRTDDVR